MSGNTEVESIAHAKKDHKCTWCWQKILQGEPYKRWRNFYQGEACTVKMHPECNLAWNRWTRENGYDEQWYEGEFSRGCTCANGECTVENCPTDAPVQIIKQIDAGTHHDH